MASDGISVAIIGGGIGGLAAASSLLRVGIDVHVYEQARELTEVGAGIQISPNASRILHRLGLAVPAALMYCQRPHAHIRYERLRLPRATRVQGLSEGNKQRFHLPDGPAQLERDAEMARGTTDWSLNAVDWLYGHDAGTVRDSDAHCVSRSPANNSGVRRESNQFLTE
jgi:2-polyprenyl-6-methoxyphenol hydroxylase-like FAD-dependent oxidoreductase